MTVPLKWKKSSRSAAEADCVEVAPLATGVVAVRDSKNPAGPSLKADLPGLLTAVKAGRLDG